MDELCVWSEELSKEQEEATPWGTWKALKRAASSMGSDVNKMMCTEQIVITSDEDDEIAKSIQEAENESRSILDNIEGLDEVDCSPLNNIVAGYNVQEFPDTPATRELVCKIEHDFLYQYNRCPTDDDIYYELRILSSLVEKRDTDNIAETIEVDTQQNVEEAIPIPNCR